MNLLYIYLFINIFLNDQVKWMRDMKADSAVSQYYLSPEIHAKFMTTHQAGTPDFDILTHE